MDGVDGPAPVRPSAAALALGKVGVRAVPALVEALSRAEEPARRVEAAHALGLVGRGAAEALPALAAAREKDADPAVREAAQAAQAAVSAR